MWGRPEAGRSKQGGDGDEDEDEEGEVDEQEVVFGDVVTPTVRREIGPPVKAGVSDLFPNYDFTALTWADLTRSMAKEEGGGAVSDYINQDGDGPLKRGAQRYQVLVPSYTVMFAFFLVLNVGWVFVTERRQGTLRRLQAAPYPDHWPATDLFCSVLLGDGRRVRISCSRSMSPGSMIARTW